MNRKYVTYLCNALFAINAIAFTGISPLLSEISRSFSVGMSTVGLIFTANCIGFIVFTILGGILTDKMGKKAVLLISLLGMSLAQLLFCASTQFVIGCVLMFFIGGFEGIVQTLATAVVADINVERKDYYINLSTVFFGVGAFFGPIIAGSFLLSKISWRIYYLFSGISILIIGILFIFTKIASLTNVESIKTNDLKFLFKNKAYILICFCIAVYSGAEVGSWGWMSTFLKEKLHFSVMKSGIAVGVFWAGITIGRFLCGLFTDRISTRNFIRILTLSSIIAIILSGVLADEKLVFLSIAVMGLSFSSLWPFMVSLGSSCFKKTSGTVFSLLVASGGIGASIIPYLLGIVGEKFSIRAAMTAPAAFFLIILVIFSILKEKDIKCAENAIKVKG